MRYIYFSFGVMLIAVASFIAGGYFSRYKMVNGNRYVTTDNYILESPSGQQGSIPKGVVLYHFRSLPEISTYVIFVNSKHFGDLQAYDGSGLEGIVPVEMFHSSVIDGRNQ